MLQMPVIFGNYKSVIELYISLLGKPLNFVHRAVIQALFAFPQPLPPCFPRKAVLRDFNAVPLGEADRLRHINLEVFRMLQRQQFIAAVSARDTDSAAIHPRDRNALAAAIAAGVLVELDNGTSLIFASVTALCFREIEGPEGRELAFLALYPPLLFQHVTKAGRDARGLKMGRCD